MPSSAGLPVAPSASRFTLVEMLVVISIIAILAALLMPALSKTIDSVRTTSCLNNLRLIGIGMISYSDDNSNTLPSPSGYTVNGRDYRYPYFINPYLRSEFSSQWSFPPEFACPALSSRGTYWYGMNYYFGGNILKKKHMGRAIMLSDANSFYMFPNRWRKNYRYRHSDYGDGTVEIGTGNLATLHGDLRAVTYAWIDNKITTPHENCMILRP